MDLSFPALQGEYDGLWQRFTLAGLGGFTNIHQTWNEAGAITAPHAKSVFQLVEQRTGVPWFVTGIILTREAGSPPNFHAWLHNGDPMFDHEGRSRQTVHVPANRPPNPRVSWEDGAVDAYELEGLIHRNDWSPALVAWVLEKFNGWGYREYRGIPSPYLWGGTVIQKRGKYTSDRVWNPAVMDTQIGGMALLAALMQIDPSVRFTTTTEGVA